MPAMITLMYHDVVPESRVDLSGFQTPDANRYKLGRVQFRRHMEILARTASPESVTLTFDDGGLGALHAAEILEEFGFSGYFFVTTDRIGTPGFLDADQVWALHKRGHRIGSHSCSHPPRISHCRPAELKREWEESVRRLEAILRAPVRTASVPGGYFSRAVAEAAARAGIRLLFNSEPVVSTHEIGGCEIRGRFTVQQGASDEWIQAIVAGEPIPRLRSYLFWNAKKAAKVTMGNAWLQFRRAILARGSAAAPAARGKAQEAGR
jgi:peptidoglycan/xylan/chitin deacetylase (PgdA/CDA1 family)